MEIVSSSEHSETASLLQPAHCNYQTGPLKNLHQPVEDALIVVGAGLKVFVQYALGFADGLKSQLLIGHHFLPIEWLERRSFEEG
ncbi:hypothetical protein V5279_09500 [Bradyrhizobium sp. 26S5]|uniref:hypothetical protein n=1 Tax=Bradyrhizobium sp. 26S5 TaxID=3139729 RepID=UPI0030CB0869